MARGDWKGVSLRGGGGWLDGKTCWLLGVARGECGGGGGL